MRLCIFVDPQEGMTYATMRAAALQTETSGFDGFFRSDHVTSTVGHFERASTEAWMTLAGLARETTTLRLGTLITPLTFRSPGLYAKMINTVDEMSDGRIEVTIGTGWYPGEHHALGFPFPPLNTRFEMLEEYIEILLGLWQAEPFTFGGKHYSVDAISPRPRAVQQPHPTLIIGGHGAKKTPQLAAKYADEYNIDWQSPEQAAFLYGRLADECRAIGRDPEALTRSILLGAVIGVNKSDVKDRLHAAVHGFYETDVDAWMASHRNSWIVGTPEQAVARLQEYAAAGVQRAMLMVAPHADVEMIALIGSSVYPHVR